MLIHLNFATIITFLGVAASVLAVILAANNQLAYAMILLIMAGLADLFDGLIARRSQASKKARALGAELDSLADVVSFGIAPVFIFYFSGLLDSAVEWLCLSAYLFSVFQRLAHFNVNGLVSSQKRAFYTGLPVTYAALVLPLAYLANDFFSLSFSSVFFQSVFYALALLFISKIPIPKPGGISYLIFPVIAAIAITALVLGA